jgi:hypothetical protein
MIVTLFSAPALAGKNAAEPVPLSDTLIELPGMATDARQDCVVGEPDYAWIIDDYIWGLESYKAYCHTDNCSSCPPGAEDWLVENILQVFSLLEEDVPCTLYAHVDIGEVDWTDPNCPVPGDVIWESATYWIIVSEPGLYVWPLPTDSCPPVSGEFFAGYYWDRLFPEGGRPGLVLADAPCAACWSYNDYGSGPIDLCEMELGNLSLFVDLSCNVMSPVGESTWTTIKGLYQ